MLTNGKENKVFPVFQFVIVAIILLLAEPAVLCIDEMGPVPDGYSKNFYSVDDMGGPPDSISQTPADQGSTPSSGSYSVSSPGQPIIMERNIKGLEETIYKNDNITIRLKLLNCNSQNRIESINVIEEIPKEFELVHAEPSNYVESYAINGPRTITWNFKNNFTRKKYIEYTVRTNKSGRYVFDSTVLDEKIKDRNGRTYEFLQSLGKINYIVIHNRHPEYVKRSPPENPLSFKAGTNIIINISVKDEDSDRINVSLREENTTIICKSTNWTYCCDMELDETCTSHVLEINTSKNKYNSGIHRFTIVADDGESEIKEFVDLEIYRYFKLPSWLPSKDTTWGDAILPIVAIVCLKIGSLYEKRKEKKLSPAPPAPGDDQLP